jgi:predicted DNA-binding antitoxin AbrB/MazE fold protein
METFEGIYENGIVRFPVPVPIQEHSKVKVIAENSTEVEAPLGCNAPELYEIMRRSYNTGDTTAAARIDEHQP